MVNEERSLNCVSPNLLNLHSALEGKMEDNVVTGEIINKVRYADDKVRIDLMRNNKRRILQEILKGKIELEKNTNIAREPVRILLTYPNYFDQ